ncbi:O-methylsterigmatocystin oxidoreductase [Rhizoctonia solani]|uniref:O-methylsterigmatocystin oxidoreductase n=1 Tax=Rhizoctonia solani TaxID=456999 RepID=A0A0K6FLZ4_9AGAM|nr:O-methylsterigmatocystin oxidoreductase [Rhizoctonia solani]
MLDTLFFVSLSIATGLLAYITRKDKRNEQPALLPSPQPHPLFGNLFSMPNEHEHLGFMRLGEELGSRIFSLKIFGETIIILNGRDDPVNLFEKRSAIYSDRACPPMVKDPSLLDWAGLGTLVGYGSRWRKYRRLMNPWLNKQAVVAYHKPQEHATRRLLQALLDSQNETRSSHELEDELSLAVSAILFRSLYGYEATSSKDPLIVRTQKLFSYVNYAVLASNYLVNLVPALSFIPEWFPGAGWKREASKWRREKEYVINETYNIGLNNMQKSESSHIMIASLQKQALKLGLADEEVDDYVKHILITLVGAGRETTVNTLLMFFLAMVLHPEVQKKAQEELDSVIGNTRLPNFEDRPQLVYIERVIQELLRWSPVIPLTPHTCFQDDSYKGYHIPEGAILVGNIWAMTRDETVYKDPEAFDPDRFLEPSTPSAPTFGWGRRRCPGVHFAEASLFISIASILMAFDIGVAQDENGKDILPSGKVTNSLVLAPQPFMFRLSPRSTVHEELIRNIA